MKTQKFLISAFALAGAIVVLTTSCGKDDDPVPASLPAIGGFNNADEVAAADLVAYWPLNGSGNESKSNTAPATTIGASYENGAKGQGLKLTNGYLTFPAISAIPTTLTGYTISVWANVKNNQTATPGSGTASIFFCMSRPNEWQGNINLYAETGQLRPISDAGVVNDSIKIKTSFRSSVSDGQDYENLFHLEQWMIADNLLTPGKHVANPVATGGKWSHYVGTWDGATNKFVVYINGKKSSNPAFEVRGANTSIVFDTPSTVVIGGFGNVATTLDTWNKPMNGSLDEIRVWKKALSASDIGSLYELEKAGR